MKPAGTEGSRRRKSSEPNAAREAWDILLRLLREDQPVLIEARAGLGLSAAQSDLLSLLEPGSTLTMVAIARLLACHDSNVTGLVDKLEQRGLIARQANPKDRRERRIGLTPEGVHVHKALLAKLQEPLPFLACMKVSDQRAIRDILRRAAKVRGKQAEADG
jgi:MarR family transcriptional regulator, organic hydroperoxide resistance regulator